MPFFSTSNPQHIDERGFVGRDVSDTPDTHRWPLLLVALMVCSLAMPVGAQTPTAPGVEIDCEEKQPEMDVHPLNDPVVEITCTVKNPHRSKNPSASKKNGTGWKST